MKEMKKVKAKMKSALHKDAKQDKALVSNMLKKEMPKMKSKSCK